MMLMIMPEAKIAADPVLATILVSIIGAAVAALCASARVLLAAVNTQRCKLIPVLCLMLSLGYILLARDMADDLDTRQAVFMLCVFILINAVLIDLSRQKRGK